MMGGSGAAYDFVSSHGFRRYCINHQNRLHNWRAADEKEYLGNLFLMFPEGFFGSHEAAWFLLKVFPQRGLSKPIRVNSASSGSRVSGTSNAWHDEDAT